MEIVLDNPFRVLGLPVTATDRQISKRVDDLSMFCEMGKSKQYDTDFPFISTMERTPGSIQRAASQIELPDQKLLHAIFWFWPGNSVDELVFELLKDGNTQKARELWGKPLSNGGITVKNFPNYRNLALMNMALSIKAGHINQDIFLSAVAVFVKTLNHDSFLDFLRMVGGRACKVSVDDIQRRFVDEAYKVVGTLDGEECGNSVRKFIDAFEGSTEQIIQYVRSKYTSGPVRRLETEIQECQETRQADPSSIYLAAGSLYGNAKGVLKDLEGLLTKQDMHYQYIADKVATELIRCSTEHFNAMIEVDDSSAPIDQAEEITLWAKDVAAGSRIKAKVEEDLSQIESIREQKEQEVDEERIGVLAEQIAELFGNIPKPDGITESQIHRLPQTLRDFISHSKRLLSSVREIGGDEHEGYLYLSNIVATIV